MIKAAAHDSHAADAGVMVGQRAQGGPDKFYEVRMVWEEGVLPERSERFSASDDMSTLLWRCEELAVPILVTKCGVDRAINYTLVHEASRRRCEGNG